MEAKDLAKHLLAYFSEEEVARVVEGLANTLEARTKRMRELEVALDEAKAELQQYVVQDLRANDVPTRAQLIENNEALRAHNAAQQRALTEAHEQIRRLAGAVDQLQQPSQAQPRLGGGIHDLVGSSVGRDVAHLSPEITGGPRPSDEVARINRALVRGDLGTTTSGLPIDSPPLHRTSPSRLDLNEQEWIREGKFLMAIRHVKLRLGFTNSEAKNAVYSWARQGGLYYRSPPRRHRPRP